jgi:hypothetical protein
MTAAVANGVFNIGVGDTSAGGDALTYNFQDSDTIYLNVQVATKVDALCTGGSEVFETLNPRTRVVASGYAINSDRLDGFNAGANASGTMIPVVASDTLTLAGVNPQINAAGTNTLTLQGGAGTGAIQFFSSNNYLTSTTFRMAGMVSANALQMTATPTQAVNFSLAALGPAIQLGAASGTYIGINTSGTFNGDYLEFENNSSTVFNVASSGQLTIGTSTNVAGALLNIATSTNIFTVLTNGNVGIGTTIPGGQLAVAANGVPTADQVTISNLGFPINTSGTNNLQLTYVGGNTGAIESGGERISITPGSGAQSTWNGLRIVAATTTVNTVTMNGLKFDSLGAGGAGLERAIFVDTGWDTAFAAAGVPGQRASSSLIRLGQLLAGGNVLGTFLSVNQTTSTGADFLNFQLASSSIFKVASSGAVVIGTSTPVGQLAVVAPAVPTADQVTISNLGFPINTSGTNNLQLTYVGGNATSIESGAQRISFTPGSGAGSTWNALRVVAATTTLNTVTMNGLKFDSVGAGGVGLERAVFVDTGWDTAFAAAGVPGQRATSSLVRLGQFLSGGNVAGTYLSINEATSTGADFMNFQLASSSIFKVASSGAVIIGTSTPFSATTTALTVCPLRTSTSTCTFSVTATTGTVMWVGSTNNATTGVSIIAKGKVLTATNDFGEYINVVGSDTDYGVGDLLSIASSGSNLFQKSATPYDPQIAGAITDSAGFIGGSDNGNGSNVIALAGRIPVKVTGVNGPIAIGDYITSSNIPGYGMRATQPGRVVGVAMQVFNGTDANTTGTVMIFVNPGWAPGSLTSASSSTSANLSIDSPLQQFFGIVASVGNTVQSFIRASIIAV